MNFTPIFDSYNIPKSDRPALVRFFTQPGDSVPRKLYRYVYENKPFYRACLRAITAQFLKDFASGPATAAGRRARRLPKLIA